MASSSGADEAKLISRVPSPVHVREYREAKVVSRTVQSARACERGARRVQLVGRGRIPGGMALVHHMIIIFVTRGIGSGHRCLGLTRDEKVVHYADIYPFSTMERACDLNTCQRRWKVRRESGFDM